MAAEYGEAADFYGWSTRATHARATDVVQACVDAVRDEPFPESAYAPTSTFAPKTPAGRLAFVQELADPRDEDGNPLPPLISKADAARMLDTPSDECPGCPICEHAKKGGR